LGNRFYFVLQIWTLECDHKEGYFYIVNTKYHPARLAKWGWGDQDTGTFDGGKFTDQVKSAVPYRAQIIVVEQIIHVLCLVVEDKWRREQRIQNLQLQVF